MSDMVVIEVTTRQMGQMGEQENCCTKTLDLKLKLNEVKSEASQKVSLETGGMNHRRNNQLEMFLQPKEAKS